MESCPSFLESKRSCQTAYRLVQLFRGARNQGDCEGQQKGHQRGRQVFLVGVS